jgi:hypothetical protein
MEMVAKDPPNKFDAAHRSQPPGRFVCSHPGKDYADFASMRLSIILFDLEYAQRDWR